MVAHSRPFFELHASTGSPLALEAEPVARIVYCRPRTSMRS
jgi:hypothetical protein